MIKSPIRNKSILIVSAFAMAFAVGTNAMAQATTTEKPKDPAKTQDENKDKKPAEVVTITGQKAQNRIDKQVYDLKDDVGAQTGVAADALNKVPGVSVDNDGNIALKGNQNVQVLVNGKQSALMKGENRAATLQSLAGGDIESIEIMSNPSAAFSSEGSGGIINLVLKKNRRPGKFVTLISTVGNENRSNANLMGNYSTDKFTLTASANFRKDGRWFKSYGTTERTNLLTNQTFVTDQYGLTKGRMEMWGANFGLDYNLSSEDTLSFQLNYSTRERTPYTETDYLRYDVTDTLVSDYRFISQLEGPRDDKAISLSFEHKVPNSSENLKFDIRASQSDGDLITTSTTKYDYPVLADRIEKRVQGSDTRNYSLSLDYTKPVGKNTITTGFQSVIDENEINNSAVFINPTTGALSVNPAQTNQFNSYQQVNAVYFQYQSPISEKWTIMAGLRIEDTEVNTYRPDISSYGSSQYTNVNPSAFATYILNDNAKIRMNYSKRLQRPAAQDLNPGKMFVDSQNISSGNPSLKPQITDSFEIGYEYQKGPFSYQLRSYYRQNSDVITTLQTVLDANTIETTKINVGDGSTLGLEFNINGKIGKKLNAQANLIVFNTEQDAVNSPVSTREITSVGGRINLDYALTDKDKFQFGIGTRGKTLTAQGYQTAQYMSNIGYRHQFTPFMSFVVNLTDPFALGKFRTVTDSNNIKSEIWRSMESRTYYIGLNITLGQKPKNMPDIQMPMPGPPQGLPTGQKPPGSPH